MNKTGVFATQTKDFYEELISHAGHDDAGSRLKAASMIMERCGDEEMAEVLNTLSAQMDFDDNEEASAAIGRTRARLDALIADRHAHYSSLYIKKLLDSEILELSNGEVAAGDFDGIKSCFCEHGLFDPDIFGGSGRIPYYDDENNKMGTRTYGEGLGHIQLPVSVVLERDYGLIAQLLGISTDEVRRVARYASYLVLDPGHSGLKKFAVLNEKEYHEHDNDRTLKVDMGGEALHAALEDLGYGDHPERLSFSVVAVSSPITRPMAYSKAEDIYHSTPLNNAYKNLIAMCARYRRLAELGAPDILIRNEGRMLDEAVNKLADLAEKNRQSHRPSKPGSRTFRFLYAHMGLITRDRSFWLRRLENGELNRTEGIISLDIYPEDINLSGKGSIPFKEVMEHNYDVISDYERDNAFILPGDADPDNPDEETRARMKEVDEGLFRLNGYVNAILTAAKKQREACTVRFDEKEGMYMLA